MLDFVYELHTGILSAGMLVKKSWGSCGARRADNRGLGFFGTGQVVPSAPQQLPDPSSYRIWGSAVGSPQRGPGKNPAAKGFSCILGAPGNLSWPFDKLKFSCEEVTCSTV